MIHPRWALTGFQRVCLMWGWWYPLWRCAVLKDLEGEVSRVFPVALARGKHLFPFRTEQLSPSAPMVLGSQGPGRVGRRRFFHEVQDKGPPRGGPSSFFQAVLLKPRVTMVVRSLFFIPTLEPLPDHLGLFPSTRWWGRGRAARSQPAPQVAGERIPRAAALDADGPPHRRARPSRPPSRRRSRPRARGTSE
jgi:hypothetical protein